MSRLQPVKKLSLLIAFLLVGIYGLSQSWSTVGSGFNYEVRTLYADSTNNLLYAGGSFTNSGSDTMKRIAVWNGTQWNPMGAGFDKRVMDIEVYNGEIYACGDFEFSDTTSVNYIAKWNGTSWEDVGGGLDDKAICMHVYNGNLFVGGWFENAGGLPCKYVAYWDGAVWNNVDTNITANAWPVQTIYSYQNELLIGGRFTANGSINNIARLVNGQWQALGGSAVGDVKSMKEINGDLYVVGSFNSIDSVSALNFARWDGNNWYAIYGPMSSSSNCIANYNGNIILGGAGNGYVNMGWGLLSPGIANYNFGSQNWTGIDSGFGGHVNDLAILNNTLYAGGTYSQAGNDPCYNIAQIDISTLNVSETKTKFISFFPNPADDEITIDLGTSDVSNHVVIHNSMGQLIVEYYSKQKTIKIPTGDFAEGIYFITIVNSTYTFNESFVISH
jgi:Secretion system C-terminal sorting domain